MKLFIAVGIGAVVATAAAAQEGSSFAGSVAVTSDYIFRGISQTQNDPALQAGVTWSAGNGFYAGVWGSNVEFVAGDKADIEVDFTAGYAGEVDGLTYDVGVLYYAYPGARSGTSYDYWEGAIKLGRSFGDVSWSGGVYYTPDNFAGTDDGVYLTTGLKYAFGDGFALDGNVGRSEIDPAAGPDYFDWNVGLTYSFPRVDANVRLYDTDNAACAKLCDTRVVATLTVPF
jgi:uncharacterized protein (TIGR02001 family)